MNSKQKMEVAVFRHGVIADFVNGARLERGDKARLLREKCERRWDIPGSHKTRISRSTILRWIRLYEKSGGKLESLSPASRSDRGKVRCMDPETALSLIALRQEMPKATVHRLMEEMEKRGLVRAGVHLNRSTVYRFLRARGLMGAPGKAKQDRRRFEAELPNDLWQSDVMHGPMVNDNGRRRKSYLIAFLDDHSRLLPHGAFYLSEGIASYLAAFETALLSRGLPRKLYVDNGAAFRSKHLEQVTASLGIALIHTPPYTPEGRGKIERFFRSVRSMFLPDFTSGTLEELNATFHRWLNETYHQRKHGATGQTPFGRFSARMECIRTAPADLKDHFRKVARRRVANDRIISLDGRLYEGPVTLIGEQVELLYHEDDPGTIEVRHGGKSHGMAVPVNLGVNNRVKRAKAEKTPGAGEVKPAVHKEGLLFGGRWEAGNE